MPCLIFRMNRQYILKWLSKSCIIWRCMGYRNVPTAQRTRAGLCTTTNHPNQQRMSGQCLFCHELEEINFDKPSGNDPQAKTSSLVILL